MVYYKYLKANHLQLLSDKEIDYTISGTLIEVTLIKVGLTFFANNDLYTRIAGAVGWLVVEKTTKHTLTIYLKKGLPVSHSNYHINDDKKFVIIDGEKIWLDQCDQNLEYLFRVLKDKSITRQEKKDQCFKTLMNYLNLNT